MRTEDLLPKIDEENVYIGNDLVKWREVLDTYMSYNEPIIVTKQSPRWPSFIAGVLATLLIRFLIYTVYK